LAFIAAAVAGLLGLAYDGRKWLSAVTLAAMVLGLTLVGLIR